jgi:hypothetical protein
MYACNAENLTTTLNDRYVTEISGNHLPGMNNKDVRFLSIFHQNCHFIPKDIDKFFPNLEDLTIRKSNVQFLMTGDLDGLNKLKTFDVASNPIDHIGQDFFSGHSSITSISFESCHIKKVDFGAFNDLKNLSSMNFEYNECIDMTKDFNKRNPADYFFNQVYERCHGRGNTIKTINFKECRINQHQSTTIIENIDYSSLNYFLFPLGMLSMLLCILLALVIFRINGRRSEKDFNEAVNNGFADYEA